MIGAGSREPERARRRFAATIAAATPAVSKAVSGSQAAKPRCSRAPVLRRAVVRDCEAEPRLCPWVVTCLPKACVARSSRSLVGLLRVDDTGWMTRGLRVRILPSIRRCESRVRLELTARDGETREDGTAERAPARRRVTAVFAAAG
jgi:hypothetical protein